MQTCYHILCVLHQSEFFESTCVFNYSQILNKYSIQILKLMTFHHPQLENVSMLPHKTKMVNIIIYNTIHYLIYTVSMLAHGCRLLFINKSIVHEYTLSVIMRIIVISIAYVSLHYSPSTSD